jgi:hypothetical protein
MRRREHGRQGSGFSTALCHWHAGVAHCEARRVNLVQGSLLGGNFPFDCR